MRGIARFWTVGAGLAVAAVVGCGSEPSESLSVDEGPGGTGPATPVALECRQALPDDVVSDAARHPFALDPEGFVWGSEDDDFVEIGREIGSDVTVDTTSAPATTSRARPEALLDCVWQPSDRQDLQSGFVVQLVLFSDEAFTEVFGVTPEQAVTGRTMVGYPEVAASEIGFAAVHIPQGVLSVSTGHWRTFAAVGCAIDGPDPNFDPATDCPPPSTMALGETLDEPHDLVAVLTEAAICNLTASSDC